MFDGIVKGFFLLLDFGNLIAIFFGTGLGILLGAIPGLTGIMAIALIIPFTYYLNPVPSLILLLGVSKGAIYAGGIPAILINTPGTPADAATVLDGYPLARQGKALKALKMALYSSFMADFLSDVILIFTVGLLASIALKFGPAEYGMLILFSLTIIAAVSGENAIKGLISAAVGLFLGTIGLDPMEGIPRFDFGMVELYEGIALVPMLIGLFAFSEILRQGEEKIGTMSKRVFLPLSPKPEDNRVTKSDWKRCLQPIARAGIMGTFLGAIPGIGPTVAAFVGYGEAKRVSKNPALFGKGALEGVAASEAANNATSGANLIPLLSLGVPGDVTAAVLLGAFMIQGLTPGPLLFEKHRYIIYAFFMGLILCNFSYLFLGTIAIKIAKKICTISKTMIFPVVLILCCVGSYAMNNSMFDVKIMFFFGILGYFMDKLGFATPPMMIAFILEPIGEMSIRQALVLSQGSISIFFTHPIALGFILLTIIVILLGIIKGRAAKRIIRPVSPMLNKCKGENEK